MRRRGIYRENNATSGTFKGTVQAESFIGDVAVGQTFSDIEGDNVTRNFVYTDSGNLPGEKHVVIMALVKVQISATEAGAGITQTKGTAILTIGGSSRTIDVYTPQILTDRVLRTSRLCTAPALPDRW
jgi:hypothetical protein